MHTARTFVRLFFLAVAMLLLPTGPVLAGGCCTATDPDTLASPAARHLTLGTAPAAPWMFLNPVAGHLPGRAGGSRQFDHMFERHLWLMGGVQLVPTGLPLTPKTSAADRTSFSQAGLGLGYMLSSTLRATTNWNTGLGRYNVSPGSQFTLGIALRY